MHALILLMMAIPLTLIGCGEPLDADLHDWMLDQRNNLKPKSTVVEPPKQFQPKEYEVVGKVDPFAIQKLISGLRAEQSNPISTSSLITPELSRRREPLESYPLDAMAMVGTLIKSGRQAALLRVDKLIYPAELGSYIGQNYGKIVKIADTELVLREIVQDGAGEWVERRTTLQLQEGK